ncbi:hypothetical protein C0995_015856 [Termitomyces sp. Mi166|nr:hypothetical protein C0995_015856 [Termitomyces sp. Mi166\
MSTSFDQDSWSPPTTPTNTSTAAPLPSTSGQVSSTLPIPAIEEGLQIASVTAQTASKHSSAPAPASKAPPPSLKTSTAPTSQIPRHVLAAFVVGPAGNEGHRFVTIRGTDQQIGEALVVIGKHIAKHRVHAPRKQKTGNAVPGVAAPALSPSDLGSVSSTLKPPTQQTQPPPTPTLSCSAATPPTRAPLKSLPAESPMVTGPPMTVMPSPASGSLMDTTSPMALSTLTPGMSEAPIISYAFAHYSGGNTAMHSSNTAQRSWPFRGHC